MYKIFNELIKMTDRISTEYKNKCTLMIHTYMCAHLNVCVYLS